MGDKAILIGALENAMVSAAKKTFGHQRKIESLVSDTWNHTSSVGWEYAHASIQQRASSLSGGVWTRLDKDFSFNDNSLFHIQQLHYQQSLFLNAGVRYTYLKELGDPHHASYEFGAAYVLPWTKTKLRANYATGFSRNTSTVFFNSPTTAPVSFDNFGVTETRSWEVGFDQPLFNDKLLFQFTYYELDKEGQARLLTVAGTSTRFFVNDDNSKRKGIELYLEARPLQDVRLIASLATIDTKFTSASANPALVGFDFLPTSDLTAAVGANWLATAKLRLGTLATYQSEQEQQRLSGTTVATTKRPSYWRWNAWAEYAITPAISAGVRVENILGIRDLGTTSQATGQPRQNSGKDPGILGAVTLRYRW
jgi:vitamin B12 transporter